jgi:serine/threonine protein kinase
MLSAGQMLGHFEVLGKIGAGGMGVVYQARDTRLNRLVAIKVIQPGRAGDATCGRACWPKLAPLPRSTTPTS